MQANYVAAVVFELLQQLERKSHREWEPIRVGGRYGNGNGLWRMENGERRLAGANK